MATILNAFRLDGKVAVVTGGSRGLGAGIAIGLAQAGADVVIAARSLERLAGPVAEIEALGRRALAVEVDLTDESSCQALIDSAVTAFGAVDILVNNAGLSTIHPATRETAQEFREVVETNLMGTYWCAQAFGRAATRGGSIVNISSSIASRSAGIPQAAYAASKAGVEALTRDLANQWGARKGIRVNSVAPGYFQTGLTVGVDEAMTAAVSAAAPLARAGEIAEVAAAVLFFASAASAYITGDKLTLDGGLANAGSMFGATTI